MHFAKCKASRQDFKDIKNKIQKVGTKSDFQPPRYNSIKSDNNMVIHFGQFKQDCVVLEQTTIQAKDNVIEDIGK